MLLFCTFEWILCLFLPEQLFCHNMPSKLWGSWSSRANMTDSWVDCGFYTQTNLPQPGCLKTQQIEQMLCPRLTWKSSGISLFKNPQKFEGFIFQFPGRFWYISIRKVTDGTCGACSQQLFDTTLSFKGSFARVWNDLQHFIQMNAQCQQKGMHFSRYIFLVCWESRFATYY